MCYHLFIKLPLNLKLNKNSPHINKKNHPQYYIPILKSICKKATCVNVPHKHINLNITKHERFQQEIKTICNFIVQPTLINRSGHSGPGGQLISLRSVESDVAGGLGLGVVSGGRALDGGPPHWTRGGHQMGRWGEMKKGQRELGSKLLFRGTTSFLDCRS